MPYNHLVTYRCTDAPFTGVLKNFTTSAKNSGHGVNFEDNFQNFSNSKTTPRRGWKSAVRSNTSSSVCSMSRHSVRQSDELQLIDQPRL